MDRLKFVKVTIYYILSIYFHECTIGNCNKRIGRSSPLYKVHLFFIELMIFAIVNSVSSTLNFSLNLPFVDACSPHPSTIA